LYLQEIVNRIDMRTNPIFRKFIEIDSQIPESVSYHPLKQASIGDLQLGGRDFELVLQKGFLFVAMSEMNIATRIDSYITNVSRIKLITVLSSLCLGIKNQNNPKQCTLLWVQSHATESSLLRM